MGKNNSLLIIGGLALGYMYLKNKSADGATPSTFLNIFPSGGGDNILPIDLTRYTEGLTTPQFDLSSFLSGQSQGQTEGFLSGLSLNLGSLSGQSGQSNQIDWNAYLSGLLSGISGGNNGILNPVLPSGGNDTTVPDNWSEFPPNYPNTIPNILTSLGYSADKIAKGGLILGGTYLGIKAVSPVLPSISNLATQIVTKATPAISGITGSVSSGVTSILGGAASYLGTPVTSLGVTGTLGAVALVPAAGALGYVVGKELVENTGLSVVPEMAGDVGAWASRNVESVPVVGNTISSVLGWEHADVVQSSYMDLVKSALAQGMTPSQAALWVNQQVNKN